MRCKCLPTFVVLSLFAAGCPERPGVKKDERRTQKAGDEASKKAGAPVSAKEKKK